MDCDNTHYTDEIEAMETQNIDPGFNEEMEDQARSEAEFNFKIENFSKMGQQHLSPPHYVRSLPWKIMAVPRVQDGVKYLGFFLQCNAENESTNWTCHASAELRILPQKTVGDHFARKINHLFHSKENDWGFSHFMAWEEILNPDRGYYANDSIILEVHVSADAPHGVSWDSKKHTGYVGLKNQGATCYMNSLLQTLYFTNQLRKAVYKMPTESDDSTKSVALALQRVFYDLQFSDKPVGTKKLTKSFGWETLDSFMQHDVQEFLRVLLDKLESKMKGTCIEGMVPKLFEGKMVSYIKCKNVPYTSSRIETYYDIQLNIKGKLNIEESFKDYIGSELLNGDNRYDAGEYGLQDAEKGVIFSSFPPVLHLHLMRFQYDPITDNSIKFNDRFEFSDVIKLDRFLEQPEKTPATYILHAVLVHSGDNHGGHYVVFINTDGKNKWCKFDDDVVSCCKKEEAINQNYGGDDDDLNLNTRNCSNAYMLVYIRESELKNVLQEVTSEDIPEELNERLREEKHMENIKRMERNEAGSVVTINVILEDYFEMHQTSDLFNIERVNARVFKIKKTAKISELVKMLGGAFNVPINKMRIWPLVQKSLQLIRPLPFDFTEKENDLIGHYTANQNNWQLFVEFLTFESPLQYLPQFDKEMEILIFLKWYDFNAKRLNYCGSLSLSIGTKISEIIPKLHEKVNFPANTEFMIYRENGNSVDRITNFNDTFKKTTDCQIIIFQKIPRDDTLELPTVEEYFKDLLHRIEITFVDKANPNDSGFVLELSNRANYEQMAKFVAHRINTDPHKIQFFKCQNYKDVPGTALSCSYNGNLGSIFQCMPKATKKLFYQKLSMNINELESKKQFKCLWLSPNMKEEKELILYPNKSGTVKTLLDEAAKVVEFSPSGTKRLRISEIAGHKIGPGPPEDTQLNSLQSGTENVNSQKTYRLEEIPPDELEIAQNEMLIPVSHFYKEVYNTFGTPFFIKVSQDEPFSSIKTRIQKRLAIPEKEFEKFKFAIIAMGRIEHITDDSTKINLALFNSSPPNSQRPFLGLEHVNKSQKRSRFNYLEKAIKIYN